MITEQEINENIGKYIRFEGFGIMDGLKIQKCKYHFYKIIGVRDGDLELKPMYAKRSSILPKRNFNQGYEIIDKKEYSTLQKY